MSEIKMDILDWQQFEAVIKNIQTNLVTHICADYRIDKDQGCSCCMWRRRSPRWQCYREKRYKLRNIMTFDFDINV